MLRYLLKLTTLSLCLACGLVQITHASSDTVVRVKALNDLLAEQWQYRIREEPEFATEIGDYRYNDKWSDRSLAHVAQQKKDVQEFLTRFQAIDTTGFAETDRLNQQLMVRYLEDNLRGKELKTYEMPLDQFNGRHLEIAQFVTLIPFDNVKHYEDYIARLNQLPKVFDQLIEVLKQGQKDQLMPPKFLLEKVAVQCHAIAEPAGEASAFGKPTTHFPDGIATVDRKRLHDAVVKAVDEKVRPAYRKLADFVAKDYAPKGRADPGLSALPNGAERYRFAIENMTTTNKDPEAIHQLGLAEVKRIEAEQAAISQKLGYKDLRSARMAMKTDPKLHASSRQQIVDLYKQYIAQMQPKLPELFGLLPKTPVEVFPIPEYREKEAAGAEYAGGTPDGSRPGKIYVNTGDYQNRELMTAESTAYHEGVPGHHMQITIAQALSGLPPFRQHALYTAYVEGWALYAERLGKEVGFFQDPYSNFGHLSDELLRANRLVLDTGVHYKRWTREQMVDFFREHSAADEPSIQAEVDRYIAWPGQALGYKLGQLKFLELREHVKQELGDKFDIRTFHDVMLNGGALPLDMLEARTNAWIASVKANKKLR